MRRMRLWGSLIVAGVALPIAALGPPAALNASGTGFWEDTITIGSPGREGRLGQMTIGLEIEGVVDPLGNTTGVDYRYEVVPEPAAPLLTLTAVGTLATLGRRRSSAAG